MATAEEIYKRDLAFASDFVVSAAGDLETATGLENLKDALFRRLVTTPGSLIHRPNYGVGIKAFQNSINSVETQRQIAGRIQEQYERDPRVEKVLGVSIRNFSDAEPEKIEIVVRYKPVGYGELQTTFTPFGGV